MIDRRRLLGIAAPVAVVLGALLVASCGGSKSTPAVSPSPSPTTTTQSLSTTGGTLNSGTVGGLSAAFTYIAGATAGTTITTTSQVGAPSGEPAPSSIERAPQSISGAVPFFYVVVTVNQAVPTSIFMSEALTITSQPTTASYYLEIDDLNNSPPKAVTIPGTLSGSTVTFLTASGSSGSNGTSVSTLVPGTSYVFMFYYVPATATPSPSPTATSTSTGAAPTPTGTSVAATWTFGGGATSAPFTQGSTPPSVTIPTNNSDVQATVALQFIAPTAGSGSLTFSTALNGCCGLGIDDVSPNTLPADDATSGNSPFIYFSIENPGTAAITFASAPEITVTLTGGSSSNLANFLGGEAECEFDGYIKNGSTTTWTAIAEASVPLGANATTFTIPAATLPNGEVVEFDPGQFVGAISCN